MGTNAPTLLFNQELVLPRKINGTDHYMPLRFCEQGAIDNKVMSDYI